jgi:hypothetical protein
LRTDDQSEPIAELQWSSSTPSLSTPENVSPQSQLYSSITFSSFDLPLKSYYLLHKIALLVNIFKITAEELTYLSNHQDDFAGTDPNDSTQKNSFRSQFTSSGLFFFRIQFSEV